MNNFTVCTYNLGSGVNDYYLLCNYLNPLKFESKEQEQTFKKQYQTTQNKTAELLIEKAHAYCFQKVMNEKRPLIESLKKKNFEIVHLEIDEFDTAIALDKNRFDDIRNHSFSIPISRCLKKDVAIATATDILSGQRVTFISAHALGLDFTQKITAKDAASGDFYCQAIVKKLSEIGNNTIQVIGADMHANPEKWNPRFQIFSNQGLGVYRTNSETNVNPKDATEPKREIDFIFTNTTPSIWQKIKSIFVSSIQFESTIKTENPLGWNSETNASDHLPVFIKISQKTNISKIQQLWNGSCSLFSSFFGNQKALTS